jgi:hypothetical protein
MTQTEIDGSAAIPKSKGEIYEGIAFQFCKVATVALIAGRYVLPLASGLCACFYVLAFINGQRVSRCVLKYPLLVAGFYGAICCGSVWWIVRH